MWDTQHGQVIHGSEKNNKNNVQIKSKIIKFIQHRKVFITNNKKRAKSRRLVCVR
jgi:hypothetical protein